MSGTISTSNSPSHFEVHRRYSRIRRCIGIAGPCSPQRPPDLSGEGDERFQAVGQWPAMAALASVLACASARRTPLLTR